MKISIISNLICAMALTLSFASVAGDKKKNKEEKETTAVAAFDAALYRINNSNKVRLLVDKSPGDRLRVVLKDRAGKVYYSEAFKKKQPEHSSVYSLVFNLDDMTDGTYYLELYHKNSKLVKKVNIESSRSKMISFN